MAMLMVFCSYTLIGQTIRNGSFDNAKCVFCAASPWVIGSGSPDISVPGDKWSTTNNYRFLNTIPTSPDGQTFANLAVENSSTYVESIYQNVSGFVIGNEYTIEFSAINTGLRSTDGGILYNDDVTVEVYLNNKIAYISGNYPVDNRWKTESFSFNATSTSYKIEFKANTRRRESVASSGGYLGLDGVNISIPLSLDLLDFYAQDNSLLWSTENEVNFSHFVIERKKEGEDLYVKIDEMESKGGSSNYLYEDGDAGQGNYFYRLKMVDKDGYFQYSKVVKVLYKGKKKSISIYPNPLTDNSQILLNGFLSERGDVSILDLTGRIIYQQNISFSDIKEVEEFIQQIDQGIYVLSIVESGYEEIQTIKFVK